MEVRSCVLFIAVLCGVMVCCWCHPQYLNYIPNSRAISDPCDSTNKWYRIGHMTQSKTDKIKNQFGKDYVLAAKNHTGIDIWTKICLLDSDGDGRSNGVELGDPECKWNGQSLSLDGVTLTHPGLNDETYKQKHCPPPTPSTLSSTTPTPTTTTTTTVPPMPAPIV